MLQYFLIHSIRGSLGSLMMMSANLGILLAFVAGNYLPFEWVPRLFICLPIIFLLTVLFFPETPFYFMRTNREMVRIANDCLKYSKNCVQLYRNRIFRRPSNRWSSTGTFARTTIAIWWTLTAKWRS